MKSASNIEDFVVAAEVLKAIAHPTRLQILVALCNRSRHVNDLSEVLGLPQSIVSQQLRILRMKDLVVATRKNGFAYYQITKPKLRDLIDCLAQCQS